MVPLANSKPAIADTHLPISDNTTTSVPGYSGTQPLFSFPEHEYADPQPLLSTQEAENSDTHLLLSTQEPENSETEFIDTQLLSNGTDSEMQNNDTNDSSLEITNKLKNHSTVANGDLTLPLDLSTDDSEVYSTVSNSYVTPSFEPSTITMETVTIETEPSESTTESNETDSYAKPLTTKAMDTESNVTTIESSGMDFSGDEVELFITHASLFTEGFITADTSSEVLGNNGSAGVNTGNGTESEIDSITETNDTKSQDTYTLDTDSKEETQVSNDSNPTKMPRMKTKPGLSDTSFAFGKTASTGKKDKPDNSDSSSSIDEELVITTMSVPLETTVLSDTEEEESIYSLGEHNTSTPSIESMNTDASIPEEGTASMTTEILTNEYSVSESSTEASTDTKTEVNTETSTETSIEASTETSTGTTAKLITQYIKVSTQTSEESTNDDANTQYPNAFDSVHDTAFCTWKYETMNNKGTDLQNAVLEDSSLCTSINGRCKPIQRWVTTVDCKTSPRPSTVNHKINTSFACVPKRKRSANKNIESNALCRWENVSNFDSSYGSGLNANLTSSMRCRKHGGTCKFVIYNSMENNCRTEPKHVRHSTGYVCVQ